MKIPTYKGIIVGATNQGQTKGQSVSGIKIPTQSGLTAKLEGIGPIKPLILRLQDQIITLDSLNIGYATFREFSENVGLSDILDLQTFTTYEPQELLGTVDQIQIMLHRVVQDSIQTMDAFGVDVFKTFSDDSLVQDTVSIASHKVFSDQAQAQDLFQAVLVGILDFLDQSQTVDILGFDFHKHDQDEVQTQTTMTMDYVKNLIDVITVWDQLQTAGVGSQLSTQDASIVTDVIETVITWQRTFEDQVAIADVLDYVRGIDLSDTSITNDSLVHLIETVIADESVSLSDVLETLRTVPENMSDSSQVTESLAVDASILKDETINVQDAGFTYDYVFGRFPSDQVSFADGPVFSLSKEIVDTVIAIDQFSTDQSGSFYEYPSDSSLASDSASFDVDKTDSDTASTIESTAFEYNKLDTDTLILNDIFSTAMTFNREYSETVISNETFASTVSYSRDIQDTVGVFVDTFATVVSYARSLEDNVISDDTLEYILGYNREYLETVVTTDVPMYVLDYNRNYEDSAGISDSSFVLNFGKGFQDIPVILSSASLEVNKPFEDTSSITDSLVYTIGFGKGFEDTTIVLTEFALSINKVSEDQTIILESSTLQIGKGLEDTLVVPTTSPTFDTDKYSEDTSIILDNTAFEYSKLVTPDIIISGDTDFQVLYGKNPTDETVVISELFTPNLIYNKEYQETTIVSESGTALLQDYAVDYFAEDYTGTSYSF